VEETLEIDWDKTAKRMKEASFTQKRLNKPKPLKTCLPGRLNAWIKERRFPSPFVIRAYLYSLRLT
jgi:hypothetical protein